MLSLLHRSILRELSLVLAITVAITVSVVAFGATIKPFIDNDLLSIAQAVKYMALATVPMLQFAIPFAAGFATTLVLHRMTVDNEVQAIAVSGVSYRRLLAPIAGLGVGLTLLMLILTHTVIPRFWAMMLETISEDATGLFVATIRHGEAYQFGDLQIYAETPRVLPAPRASDALQAPTGDGGDLVQRIVLERMAAAELDRSGAIVRDVTARHAVVDVYRRDRRTILMMAMQDAVYYNAQTGELAYAARPIFTEPIVVADPLDDETKTMSILRLRHLRTHPDEFADVIRAKIALAATLRRHHVTEYITSALRDEGRIALLELGPSPDEHRACVLYADGVSRGGVLHRDDNQLIVVERIVDGRLTLRVEAETAELRFAAFDAGDRSSEPTLELRLADTLVTDLRASQPGDVVSTPRSQNRFPGLQLPDEASIDFESMSVRELEAYVAGIADPGRIEEDLNTLRGEVRSMELDVISREYERHALSCSALLLPLLGAVLAIWQRQRSPLVTYLAAFLPAVAAFLLISGGKNIIRDDDLVLGFSVMWSGHAVLAGLIAFAYARVARN